MFFERFVGAASLKRFAAALALTASMAACKSAPPAPSVPDDASLAAAVTSKLANDPAMADEKIHATVKDGVVTLTGTASSDSQNALIYKDVMAVPGVKDVDNKLSFPVQNGGGLGGSSIPG